MGFTDIFFFVLIIIGALYLLYHSVWKKQGHCAGCETGCNNADNAKRRHW